MIRPVIPWATSLLFHGGLASLLLVLPGNHFDRDRDLPPMELSKKKPPPPPPKPKKVEPPKPPPKIAVLSRPRRPRRVEPQPPPQQEPPPKQESVPEDTGPKIYGIQMEGTARAAKGTGVKVPVGDSLAVSPKIRKKGPEKPKSGFKDSYNKGELAPVAVITRRPKVKKRIMAVYPERMRELGIEGRVVLELLIDARGRVKKVRLLRGLRPELDKEAIKAARQMIFSPATVNGTPVAIKIPYTFTFVLD